MNVRKTIAAVLSLCLASSLTACGGGSEGSTVTESTTDATTTARTEWTGDNIEVTAAPEALPTEVDISGQTLKWLGITDINPTNTSPERSAELAIFEDTYGAHVEWMVTTSSTRFSDLATSILYGRSPRYLHV